MARTIGRVEFNVDFDGKGLPARAKQIGEEAGREMGKGASNGFDDETSEIAKNLRKKMRQNGDLAGNEFEKGLNERLKRKSAARSELLQNVFGDKKGFEEYAKNFDSPIDAIDNLRKELKLLQKDGLIQEDTFKGLSNDLTVLRRETKKSETQFSKLRDSIDQDATAFRRLQNESQILDLDRKDREVEGFRKQLGKLDTSLESDRAKFVRLRNAADKMQWDDKLPNVKNFRGEVEKLEGSFERLHGRYADIESDTRNVFDGGDKSIRRHIESYDNLGDGIERVRTRLKLLRDNGNLPDTDFDRMSNSLDRVGVNALRSSTGVGRLKASLRKIVTRDVDRDIDRLGSGIGRFRRALIAIDAPGRKFRNAWRSAPHGLKQGAFYVGLFAGLAPGIATLGSVAGSALAVLATGALAVGAAIGVTIAAFKGIGGPIEDVAPKARASAKALKTLSEPLHDLQQVLQGQLFRNLSDELRAIGTKLIPGVSKGLGGVAAATGDVFEELLQGLESKGGIRTMNQLLAGFKPIIKDLGGSFLQLSAAFGHIFVEALPTAKNFFKFLDDLFTRFNDWTKSVEGQDRIALFFETMNRLAGPLGGLIGAAGKALAGMVTDQSISNMEDFLSTMTDVLNDLPDFVGIIDDLDPLGVAADILKEFFDVISDNKSGLSDLATSLGGFLKSGVKDLGPVFGDVVKAIVPFLDGLSDELQPIFDDLLPVVKKLAKDTLPEMLDVFLQLAPALEPVVDLFSDLSLTSLDNLDPTIKSLGTLANALASLVPEDGEQSVDSYFSQIGDAFAGVDLSSYLNTKAFSGGIANAIGSAIGLGLGTAYYKVKALLGDIGEGILDGIRDSFKDGAALGSFLIDGIVGGITDSVNTNLESLSVVGESIVNWFKDFFGIHSPSTLMRDVIGAFIVPGIIEGIVSNISDLGTSIFENLTSAIDTGITALAGLPGKASGALGDLVGGIGSSLAGIPGVIGSAFSAGKDRANTAKDGILAAWNALPPDVQSTLLSIPNIIGGQFRGAISQTAAAGNRIIDGVATIPGRTSSAVSGAAEAIGSKFQAAPGIVGGIVDRLVGKFSGVTSRITGAIGDIGSAIAAKFNGIVTAAQGVVANIVDAFTGLGGRILGRIGDIAGQIGAKLNFSGAVKLPATATGGVFNGSQARIIGEAGPEAVVPLNRPLNQVDPAVRALSAYAQGLSTPGVAGVGRSVTVHEGAIQVITPLSNPALVAEQVLDRLVASIG